MKSFHTISKKRKLKDQGGRMFNEFKSSKIGPGQQINT